MFLALTVAACGSGVESPQEARPGEQAQAASAPPKITTFTAKAAQGALITINGSGFVPTASVAFNGTPATTVEYVAASRLRAVVPAGATSGLLSVTVPLGTAQSPSAFLVLPRVSDVSPAHAFVGDFVTISGSGFTAANAVKFGSLAASFEVTSDFDIVAAVPTGFVSGKVNVTSASGSVTSTTVVSALPLVGSFSPTEGLTGQSVTILGQGLSTTSAVKFGTKAAVFSLVSDTELSATVPAGASTGKITVETPRGNRASATSFTVIKTPTISSFTPLTGVLPVTLTVNGTNFVSVTAVRVGTFTLPAFTLVSSKQLTAALPDGTPSGRVSVTNAAGTATSSATFTALCSDVDADSVCDADDRCAGHDDRIDSDADGTPDGCDVCPSAASAGATCGAGQACNASGACVELLCDAAAQGPGVFRGNITIDNVDTAGDLARLSGKWCVDGSLVVLGTQLTDLSALSGLAEVSGHLSIGDPNKLGCQYPCANGNQALTSLNGLQELRRVGGWLTIQDDFSDPGVATLAGLSGLRQVGALELTSNALTDLHGLEALEDIGVLYVSSASALASLSGLENVRAASNVRLHEAPLLTDISALGGITILRDGFEALSTGLGNLHGLEGLTSAGFVQLAWNPNLTDLGALSQLRDLAGLSLEGLGITSVDAFSGVTNLTSLYVYHTGLTSFAGLGGVTSLSGLDVEQNPSLLSLAGLGSPQVTYRVNINENPSLLDCGALTLAPGASVQIMRNASLGSLSCLAGSTDFSLLLVDNENLTSLADLSSLTHSSSLTLAQRRVESLAGLQNLQSVGSLDIFALAIQDMHGLESLTSADAFSLRSNSVLRSLAGLNALTQVSYYVDFDSNWNLSQCEIASFEAQIGRPIDHNYWNGEACTP